MAVGPQKTSLHQFFAYCIKGNLPFAFYRLPGGKTIEVIAQHNGTLSQIEQGEGNGAKGFIFSPFHVDKDHKQIIISPDVVCNEEDLPALKAITKQAKIKGAKQNKAKLKELSRAGFKKYVRQARKAIREGAFKKLVVARVIKVKKPSTFDPVNFYKDLCAAYPRAFVSMAYTHAYGLWIGASPEILLQSDSTTFTTYSLAGTRANTKANNRKPWGKKEKNEQKIVTDYILDTFKELTKAKPRVKGPETVNAGNLQHLRTTFTYVLDHNRWADIAEKLHPTPAVAGLPKQTAIDFIEAHESSPRGFYSGYLGPVNMDNKTNLFVNLRCMQVIKNKLAIYVGCGITADSEPSKEWRESEIKADTLLKVLNKPNALKS